MWNFSVQLWCGPPTCVLLQITRYTDTFLFGKRQIFSRIGQKIWRNCPFTENFITKKLGEKAFILQGKILWNPFKILWNPLIFGKNFFFFFSTWVFFHEHSRITGLQGKGEGISLTPHYHFHPLHRRLDISRAIAAESSPLRIASSRTRAGDLWFPSASR